MPAQAAVVEINLVGTGVDHNSAAAYDKSVDYAKKRAVYMAARNMGVQDADERLAKISPEVLGQIVRGITITQTKREGDVTYTQASVSIVVEVLRRAMKLPEDAAATAPGTLAHGLLMLPVYVTPQRSYMWEPNNLLRVPLSDELQRQAHGAVMLSGGDFEDLRLVDYQNAMKVAPDELKPMFERYGAQEIIIAFLTTGTIDTSEPTTILLRRLTPTGARSEIMQVKPEDEKEPIATRVAKGAQAIAAAAAQIASSTADQERAALAKATKKPIRFRYVTPQELGKMQTAVRTAPHVLLLEFPAIALNDVAGTVYVDGDLAELRQALTKQGIIITDIADGWQASMR